MTIGGIHHVTSLAGAPAANVDFYTGPLGLRLVKRTVNFDDPTTYHLYFGDGVGSPGTAITFFPYGDGRSGRPTGRSGTPGAGQVTTTAFRVPEGSIGFWRDRFDEHGVTYADPEARSDETVLPFADHDGLRYELVAVDGTAAEPTDVDPWTEVVPAEHAIRGFHGVTLTVADPEPTAEVLQALGFEPERDADGRARYRITGPGPGTVVTIVEDDERGSMGVGCVHHVAFRTPDDETQAEWQCRLRETGRRVTDVRDRRYFRSIYFREPGGVLFEIATEGPGFDRDEDRNALGEELKLPPWLAGDRERIEGALPEIDAENARVVDD